MKKGFGNRAQGCSCNTVLKVWSMIGVSFLVVAGGPIQERTYAPAKERTYDLKYGA